jgi:hypothetical protein
MIVLEDDECSGHWMPGAHDHAPPMTTEDELKNLLPGRAACGGDRTVAGEDWVCAQEEWSYDLFDLQDSGLVPSY